MAILFVSDTQAMQSMPTENHNRNHAGVWNRGHDQDGFFEALDRITWNLPGFVYQLHLNSEGKFIFSYASESVQSMFGVTVEQVEADANTILGMIHPEDYDRVIKESMDSAEAETPWLSRFRMVKPDGQTIWVEGRDTPQRLNDGSIVWTGYVNDITRQIEMEERIRHLALHDPLTDLPNRTLFAEFFQQALEMAARNKSMLGLMYLDLDQFKPVNDRFGHGVGDQVLKHVAIRITSTIRSSDVVARIGGDEFLIILPDISGRDGAMHVAEKVLDKLSIPFWAEGYNLNVHASIGIALYPEHAQAAEELELLADKAMYHAKKDGHNRLMVYESGL